VIRRRFSDDGLNLLLTENDSRKLTRYEYISNTDRVDKKYVRIAEKIFEREFYDYDANGILIKKVHDNGTQIARGSLEGVPKDILQ